MKRKTDQVDYEVLEDADDEEAGYLSAQEWFRRWELEDVAHDIDISRAMIDVFIDARDHTDINAVMLALEGVSYRLSDVQSKLMDLVSGDE
jgi:hypothetical protein